MGTDAQVEWVELGREQVFARYARRIDRVRFRLPDGSESDYYLKSERPTAGVLALTTDEQVILVEQFRPGPNRVLLELPGGYIDPGETAEAAAARELLEETGFVGRLVATGTFYDCAYSNRVRHYFLATACVQTAAPRVTAGESGRVRLLPVARFGDHLRSGNLTDAAGAYAGLERLSDLRAGRETSRRAAA